MSRTVDGLVNIQLVNREIPSDNRRKAVVSLTTSGESVCDSINYSNDKYIDDILHDFSQNEREELINLFQRLTTNMTSHRIKSSEEAN